MNTTKNQVPRTGAIDLARRWVYKDSNHPEVSHLLFGLRRLVHPTDLAEVAKPCHSCDYQFIDDVCDASCDNILIVGQDLKAVATLTKRAMAEKDPVILTAGLLALSALSASMEPVLSSQFHGLDQTADDVHGQSCEPDPKFKELTLSRLEKPKLMTFNRSISAIILSGERLKQFSVYFRGRFDPRNLWSPTMKALRKFQLLRLTMPRKLKRHVSAILECPEVQALVPEAGRLKGAPVPLFTRPTKGSPKKAEKPGLSEVSD